jgi:type II secretory pathway pseudopilin PulG
MRGMLSLVSLLVIGVGAAYYFTSMQAPVQQAGEYQNVQTQAQHAASLMQHDGEAQQAQVDAAIADPAPASSPATTNTPAPTPAN